METSTIHTGSLLIAMQCVLKLNNNYQTCYCGCFYSKRMSTKVGCDMFPLRCCQMLRATKKHVRRFTQQLLV